MEETKKSTAPYNFVRLNKSVLQPPVAEGMDKIGNYTTKEGQEQYKAKYSENISKGERFTGYFDVEIVNKTPMFIGGYSGSDSFFSDGRNYCIPGSSLRGCLKNLFKIITNGSMRTGIDGDIEDGTLYFRDFASEFGKLKTEYTAALAPKSSGGKQQIQVSGGLLVKEGEKYYIFEAPYTAIKVSEGEANKYDKPTVEYADDQIKVFSGPIEGKKHYYKFTDEKVNWKIKYVVTRACLDNYLNDKNRNGINLLESEYGKQGRDYFNNCPEAKNYSYIIPCFFVADGNMVRNFGSGILYRVPYNKSIGQHIPQGLNTSKVDFADAVFGNKELWGSRVFFDDLYLQGLSSGVTYAAEKAQPLLGPKPTSFQNYLMTDEAGEAEHWNSKADLRGYKLYWHKTCNWKDSREKKEQSELNQNINKSIAPIKENNRFCGRLRFENLDAIELGALAKLFALGEEENSCYKLGMGKSLGLGSVKITGKLFLRNDDYYQSFLSAGVDEVSYKEYVEQFDAYVSSKLSDEERHIYDEKMAELKIIMDYSLKKSKNWDARTAYINVDDDDNKLVANRYALPCIADVAGAKK